MRLKLIRGATLAEAMDELRRVLGPDVLILSTRTLPGNRGVEIAAALEDPEPPPEPIGPLETAPAPAVNGHAEVDPALLAPLLAHGIPIGLAEQLGSAASIQQALVRHFRFLPLLTDAPLLVAGTPGAGKTLLIAKLATALRLEGTAPLVITADGNRAGAAEQLAAFTRILGLDLVVASHPGTLAKALERRRQGAPTLIDGPGLDPREPEQLELLRSLIEVVGAAPALVLPAGLDVAEAAELGEAFAMAGADRLVATRLDLVRRLGGVIAAAEAGDFAFGGFGHGPSPADPIETADPEKLARRLHEPPRRDNGVPKSSRDKAAA